MLARNARIDAAPEARLLSTAECARLIVIGWFVNSVAWLRLGDAYRAYAFSQDSRSSFSKSLGTILAERALDTATILAILAVAAVILTTTHSSTTPVYVLAATLALALALSALLLTMKYLGVRLAEMLPGRLGQAFRRFQEGTLGSFKNLPALALLGIVGWALEIARMYFVVEALGSEHRVPAAHPGSPRPRRTQHSPDAGGRGGRRTGSGRTPRDQPGAARGRRRHSPRPLHYLRRRDRRRRSGIRVEAGRLGTGWGFWFEKDHGSRPDVRCLNCDSHDDCDGL